MISNFQMTLLIILSEHRGSIDLERIRVKLDEHSNYRNEALVEELEILELMKFVRRSEPWWTVTSKGRKLVRQTLKESNERQS